MRAPALPGHGAASLALLALGLTSCRAAPPSTAPLSSPPAQPPASVLATPTRAPPVLAPAAPPSSVSPPAVGSSAPDDTEARCQQEVDSIRQSGGVGLYRADPSTDELCQWRIEDAIDETNREAMVANIQQLRGGSGPSAPPSLPGQGVMRVRGRLPSGKARTAFVARAASVKACARGVPGAPPVLRTRVVLQPDGQVAWARVDYRTPLDEVPRDCVERALSQARYPASEGGRVTVMYVFAFGEAKR